MRQLEKDTLDVLKTLAVHTIMLIKVITVIFCHLFLLALVSKYQSIRIYTLLDTPSVSKGITFPLWYQHQESQPSRKNTTTIFCSALHAMHQVMDKIQNNPNSSLQKLLVSHFDLQQLLGSC